MTPRQMSDQQLFECLQLLVILHGNHDDVEILHEFKNRFNELLRTLRRGYK
jgi:hypothetical protein